MKVMVIPIIASTLRTASKGLENRLAKLKIIEIIEII